MGLFYWPRSYTFCMCNCDETSLCSRNSMYRLRSLQINSGFIAHLNLLSKLSKIIEDEKVACKIKWKSDSLKSHLSLERILEFFLKLLIYLKFRRKKLTAHSHFEIVWFCTGFSTIKNITDNAAKKVRQILGHNWYIKKKSCHRENGAILLLNEYNLHS